MKLCRAILDTLRKSRILPLVETAFVCIHSAVFIATMNPFVMIPMMHSLPIIIQVKMRRNGENSFSVRLQVLVILSRHSSSTSRGKCLPRVWCAPTTHVTRGSSWCLISKSAPFVYLRILSSKAGDANDGRICFPVLSRVVLHVLVCWFNHGIQGGAWVAAPL